MLFVAENPFVFASLRDQLCTMTIVLLRRPYTGTCNISIMLVPVLSSTQDLVLNRLFSR